jgi:hypothetical protein
MPTFDPHPGMVEMIDAFMKKSERVAADSLPPDQQFVYLDAKGVGVNDPARAAQRIPIVSVVTTPLDSENVLVPLDEAVKVLVQYLGPDKKPLRTTTMVRTEPGG